MKWVLYVICVIGVGLGVAMQGFGLVQILRQQRLIKHSVPVEARVIEVNIKDESTSRNSSFKPVVVFQYEFDGAPHVSSRVLPSDESGSLAWAAQIVAPYERDQKVEAYCDPDKPSEAFLVRRYGFEPYGIYVIGMMMGIGSLWLAWYTNRQDAPPQEPKDSGDGWYTLRPPWTLSTAMWACGGFGVIWLGLGVPAWGHFLLVGEPPYGWMFWATVGIHAGVGALLLGVAGWAATVSVWHADPLVLLDRKRPGTGMPLHIRVEQTLRRKARIKHVSAKLVCKQVQRIYVNLAPNDVTKKLATVEAQALNDLDVEANEPFAADLTLVPPADAPPSSPLGRKSNPRVEWELHIKTALRGGPPYPDKFVLQVEEGVFESESADDEVIETELAEGEE